MRMFIALVQLTAALMFVPLLWAWHLVLLPFRILGSVMTGAETSHQARSSSGPKHYYMVQSEGRIRSYFITRGS